MTPCGQTGWTLHRFLNTLVTRVDPTTLLPLQKVLIVDDEPVNVELLKHILGRRYEVATAMTGEVAIEVATHFVPDLVLLDIMLPGIDGYDVCRWIRSAGDLNATKVIMVSAKAMESDRRAGFAAGTDDYLTKPFRQAELLEKMRTQLDNG